MFGKKYQKKCTKNGAIFQKIWFYTFFKWYCFWEKFIPLFFLSGKLLFLHFSWKIDCSQLEINLSPGKYSNMLLLKFLDEISGFPKSHCRAWKNAETLLFFTYILKYVHECPFATPLAHIWSHWAQNNFLIVKKVFKLTNSYFWNMSRHKNKLLNIK